ncbi:hypothetical protein HG531_005475 [Fusarium graminearum]|nr:hypothetical protein HG531_005475 [Fusarium graminearum]
MLLVMIRHRFTTFSRTSEETPHFSPGAPPIHKRRPPDRRSREELKALVGTSGGAFDTSEVGDGHGTAEGESEIGGRGLEAGINNADGIAQKGVDFFVAHGLQGRGDISATGLVNQDSACHDGTGLSGRSEGCDLDGEFNVFSHGRDSIERGSNSGVIDDCVHTIHRGCNVVVSFRIEGKVVCALDNIVIEHFVAILLDQQGKVLGKVVVVLLGGFAVELSEKTVRLTGLVPLRPGELGSDNIACSKVETVLAETPEKDTNVEGLEHEPRGCVGEGTRSKESKNKATLVDLDITTSQLRVDGNTPGLYSGSFLLLCQPSEGLITVDPNGIAKAEFESLQNKSCGLEEEVVARNPHRLDSSEPGLSANMDR